MPFPPFPSFASNVENDGNGLLRNSKTFGFVARLDYKLRTVQALPIF